MSVVQSNKAKKTKKIVEAAQQIFSEKGFHKTTVDEIAERAKVAKGTVYLYFPDKQALFEHILQELFEEYQGSYSKILEEKNIDVAIKAYIEVRLKIYSENAKLVRIHLLSDMVNEETKHIVLKMHRYHIDTAVKLIEGGMQLGLLKCKDAFAAALALNGIINQYALYHIITTEKMHKDKITTSILDVFFEGIKA